MTRLRRLARGLSHVLPPSYQLILLLSLAAVGLGQRELEPYFSLSSFRTYGSNTKPSVTVSGVGVSTLQFRVYRVNDPEQFFRQLESAHNFSESVSTSRTRRTLLERIHRWKSGLRAQIRRSLRAQFTEPPSNHFALLAHKPVAAGGAGKGTQYAEAPILNPDQLVLTFTQPLQSKSAWQQSTVEVPVKDKGVYMVEAVNGPLRAYTILMVSDTVMISKDGSGRILNFVVDRNTGLPLAHIRVVALARNKTLEETETDAEGIAEMHPTSAWPEDVRLIAQNGRDVAASAVPGGSFGSGERWTGYIYTDRPVYRPGHTVRFKGILRVKTAEGLVVPAGKSVNVEIDDSDQKPVYQRSLAISAAGTISDSLDLPAKASLGNYFLKVTNGENQLSGDFDVEEYKKPEYEVHVTPSAPRVLEGARVQATIDAKYYFGEPVAGAKLKYAIYRSRYWSPLLYDSDDEDMEPARDDGDDDSGDQVGEQDGQLDPDGKLVVNIPTSVSDNKFDYRYRIEARVTDAANREIDGTGYAVATYASYLIKVAPQRYFYEPGNPATFRIQARDYNNQPVRTKVHVELLSWNYREPEKSQVKATTDADLDANGSADVTMNIPAQGGSYRIRAQARGASGRQPEGSSALWVSGGSWESEESAENPAVQIIPDKKSYAAGDVAHLLVVTGKPNTPVYVAIEGQKVREYKYYRTKDTTVSFSFPVAVSDEPGLAVTASFIRDGVFHNGSKYVRVPPVQHQMNVAVTTDKPQYLPGETAEYNIEAKSTDGKPVANAEFSLGVVDEAIYGIRQDTMPTLIDFFYSRDYNAVSTENSLEYFFNGQAGKRQMQLAQLRPPSRLAQLKPDRMVLPKIRKAFPDTAFWDADLVTDSTGHARAKVEFPDSLTTWRATARGVTADSRVGNAVAKTLVRKNLILRVAAPRFFVQGDEVVLSALVHNYLTADVTAHVSLDVKGLDILDGSEKDVQIPQRGEAKVNWRVRVQQVHSVTITGKALTSLESDALELNIPVDIPGVKLNASNGGSVTPGGNAAFDVTFPDKVQPGSRSLSIQLSPSVAGSLFGALDFLTSFPYGCVEQTMSSFLPNIIVRNTARDLNLDVKIDEDALQQKIRAGLDRLYSYQHPDGGWGWWETDETHPFMTAYVVAGLAQANAGGVSVPPDILQRGTDWLKQEFNKSQDLDPDLRAYIAYALALAGQSDAGILNRAYGLRSSMSSYGLAVLGLALDQMKDVRASEIAAIVEVRAQQDAQQAWWPAERDSMLDFAADTTPEATAFAAKLLSRQHRGAGVLPKAALWLMNHRNEGAWWGSTKQTAMVIYGLADYLRSTNELKPNLTATVFVNGRAALTKKIDQVAGANPEIKLDESQLAAGVNHVRVEVSGDGRLYYSSRSEYYSGEARLEKSGAVSLNLLRDYFRLLPSHSGEKIVYDTAPLNGPVQIGDILAVRLTLTGSEWKYMLVEDPIPAGTEFLAADNLYEVRNRPPWWRYEFTRRELHDDRMAIFQTVFPQGQQQYFYLLKVVNPGSFKVSPARAGPMYQPQISTTTESRVMEVK